MSDSNDPREVAWHPRYGHKLLGHEKAERQLLSALAQDKMHHGWLISGPRGIGKATLAYRLARFLLAGLDPATATDLSVPDDHPSAKRIAARGHGDLLVLERKVNDRGKLMQNIAVEEARRLSGFFNLTASEGGWRVAIIDAADDLNIQSANALLKTLEEPPSRALLILVGHSPGGILPTIRSRVLNITLSRLTDEEVLAVLKGIDLQSDLPDDELAAVARLANGSPGMALRLLNNQGAAHFLTFKKLMQRQGGMGRAGRLELAAKINAERDGEVFEVFCDLLIGWLADNAKAVASSNINTANEWAGLFESFNHSLKQTNALNLDRRQMLYEAFSETDRAH